MNNAKQRFIDAIAHNLNLDGIHQHLKTNYQGPVDADDVCRTKIVWAVSAFDRLIHDLIRIGMVETFLGQRQPTPKYLCEPIPLSTIHGLQNQQLIPAAQKFEQAVFGKLKHLSFQDPAKLADGLGLIWAEDHKWNVLAADLQMPAKDARTRLSLVATRRNGIVHESDLDPTTHLKIPLDLPSANLSVDFLSRLGTAICQRVI